MTDLHILVDIVTVIWKFPKEDLFFTFWHGGQLFQIK